MAPNVLLTEDYRAEEMATGIRPTLDTQHYPGGWTEPDPGGHHLPAKIHAPTPGLTRGPEFGRYHRQVH